jgi:hypothetical protein
MDNWTTYLSKDPWYPVIAELSIAILSCTTVGLFLGVLVHH